MAKTEAPQADAVDQLLALNKQSAASASTPSRSGSAVDRFVREALPYAEKVAAELGGDPSYYLGQWGLETGWGKSVIPNTNNYGNIKDFSGKGVAATDNMTGSRDKYRAYGSPDEFAADYVRTLSNRRYSGVAGAKDAQSFFSALKAGGYAEDPNYVRSGVRAAEMARNALGGDTQSTSIYPTRNAYVGDTEKVMRATQRQKLADESPISTSFDRGLESLKHNAGLFVDTVADDHESAAERIKAKREWDEANPAPTSSENFVKHWQKLADDDYMGMLGSVIQNPGGAFNQMVEQTPNSLPALAFQVPVGLASSALYASGWGIPIAMGLQGVAAFVGNVLPEGGAAVEEQFNKSGINPNDTRAVAQWLANNRSENLEAGVKKAGVISAVDGVTGFLAQKLVAGPTMRFAQAESKVFADAGIDASNKAARDAARATPAYQQAMAAPARELLDATTRAQKVIRHGAGFAAETVGEGVGEYAGSYAANGEASVKDAVLESIMGAGTSAAMTGAGTAMGALKGSDASRASLEALAATPVQPTIKPNSPLSNAAEIARAAQANAAQASASSGIQTWDSLRPGEMVTLYRGESEANDANGQWWTTDKSKAARYGNVTEVTLPADVVVMHSAKGHNGTDEFVFAGKRPADLVKASSDPMADRLTAMQSFVEDKAFIQALRGSQGYGPESVTEALSAFAKARNPNLDPKIRERALADLETFVQGFSNRPNFVFGQNAPEQATPPSQQVATINPQGGAVAPATPRDDGRTLNGEVITRPENMAGANPNQLSAPPVLGLPTEEALNAKRDADAAYEQAYQDLVKAEQLGESDAQIMARQQAIRDAREAQEQADARLKEIEQTIDGNRAQQTTAKRRAVLDAILADPDTANPVARFSAELNRQGFLDSSPTQDELAAIQRFDDLKAADFQPDVEPAAPNELDLYEPPKQPAKPAGKRFITPADIRRMVADGANLSKDTLTLPDGSTVRLKGPHIAAARKAISDRRKAQDGTQPGTPDAEVASEAPEERGSVVSGSAGNAPAEPGMRADRADGDGGLVDVAQPEIRSALDAAAHEAATSPLNDTPQPTDAQKEAGNYKVGRIRIQGMDISIENPKGSKRSGVSPDGVRWESTMAHHYGYFPGTKAADGDNLDVYVTDGAEDAPSIFIIDQRNQDGSFDEHKAVFGPRTEEDARAAYLANYEPGWTGLGAISSMPVDAFKAWAFDGKKKRKPLVYVVPEVTTTEEDSAPADPREAYADEKANAYIAKRGGSAPPKAVEVVRIGARKEYDKQQAELARPNPLDVPSDDAAGASDKAVDALSEEEAKAVAVRLGKKPGKDPYATIKAEHPDDIARAIAGDTWSNGQWVSAQQPTHQDPGQPAEAVTPAVVAKAVQKSARNTEFNPAEAKKWLLGEIDRAILNVPAENAELAAELAKYNGTAYEKEGVRQLGTKEFKALRDSNIAKTAKQIGFVTFDVPGDGKFKVMNTVDGLNYFRKKVEASPGFKTPSRSRSAGPSLAAGPGLDQSIADAKKFGGSVLSEIGNAIEISRLRGKEDDTLLDRFKENSGGKSYDDWRAEQEAADEIAAREEEGRNRQPSEEESAEFMRNLVGLHEDQKKGPNQEVAPKTEAVDYKGFVRAEISGGGFELRDGNMKVRVEPTGGGKYQASFRSAKSTPHLRGEQDAVDWAAAIRGEPASAIINIKASKDLDAWLKENVADQFQLSDSSLSGSEGKDRGVGSLTLEKKTRISQGPTGGRVVDDSDVRNVFQLKDGRLVWWDYATGDVLLVDPADPRYTENERYKADIAEYRADNTSSIINPLDLTPKQYHAAKLKAVADEYNLTPAEVRENYDTDAQVGIHNQEWIDAVRDAFRDGSDIEAKVLDRLHELRPGALASFMHDNPDAQIPSGYQTPDARKVEKAESDARKDSERNAQSSIKQPTDLASIFTGLASRGLAKSRAKKAAEAHPRAAQIAYVQDNFHDILTELEDKGLVKINCD